MTNTDEIHREQLKKVGEFKFSSPRSIYWLVAQKNGGRISLALVALPLTRGGGRSKDKK